MKYIHKYIKAFLGAGLLSLLLFSCAKFEDFDSTTPTVTIPSVEVSVVSIADSAITVSATSSVEGSLSVAIMIGSDTTAYNKVDLLTNNLSDATRIAFANKQVAAAEALTVSFPGLSQNNSYRILAVASNSEGNTGNLVDLPLMTNDTYAPNLSGYAPEAGYVPSDFAVELYFDEIVVLADASKMQFGYYNNATDNIDWTAVSADLVTVSANGILIEQPADPENGQYCYFMVEEGAITDLVGNAFAGFASGINEDGDDYGLYCRIEKDEVTISDITPESPAATTDNMFEVVVTFDTEIADFYNFSEDILDDAAIVFTYALSNGSTIDIPVVADSITISGATVTIKQPYVPTFGDMVFLKIGAGAFSDLYYNPSSEYLLENDGESGWLISKGYTTALIIGDYVVESVSYFDDLTYTDDVTIAAGSSANEVLITGLFGSTEAIVGVLDGDWGTLTIEPEQSFGDLMGDGSEVLFNNGFADDGVSIGDIASNGDISIVWGGYISGGDYDGYWYDIFPSSTWTKQAAGGIPVNKTRVKPSKFYPLDAIK